MAFCCLCPVVDHNDEAGAESTWPYWQNVQLHRDNESKVEEKVELPSCLTETLNNGFWGNKVLRLILLGTSDPRSSLFVLRGQRDILKTIFDDVISMWKTHIVHPVKEVYRPQPFAKLGKVRFPKPRGIQINMMPFIYSKKKSLPEELWHYWPMIAEGCQCSRLRRKGVVCYLTIDERLVKKGESHRRPGLHTESPGKMKLGGQGFMDWKRINWGGAGGIYMASNTSNTCAVWPVRIKSIERVSGRYGHGDIEVLRDLMPTPTVMEPNRMYWMSDRTPHESLPFEKNQYRQFFRMVTDQVSVWFARHSTPNPTGVKANCQIIEWDKFRGPPDEKLTAASNDVADSDYDERDGWIDPEFSSSRFPESEELSLSSTTFNDKQYYDNIDLPPRRRQKFKVPRARPRKTPQEIRKMVKARKKKQSRLISQKDKKV